MQTKPTGWNALFAASHRAEYKYLINGVEYTAADVQGTPVIDKPLMQEPCFGRCCTGSLSMVIRQHEGVIIPKAAAVVAYCRLSSLDGQTVTDWVEQGHFWISQRSSNGTLLSLTCRDGMMLAGQSYTDKTRYVSWPVAMSSVVDEIVSIMGVSLDSRTVIRTGNAYMVDYPNDDVLMSEILAMVAAAHGGSFVMSEIGKLRLIQYPDTVAPVLDLSGKFSTYRPYSDGVKTVSRVTLTDIANNQFTVGNDNNNGIELAAACDYATQGIAENVAYGYYIENETLHAPYGSMTQEELTLPDGQIARGAALIATVGLIGKKFQPYALMGAYLDPCLELGDTFAIHYKGVIINLVAGSIKMKCGPYCVCDLADGVQDDDEDEFPYISTSDLQAQRYVSTTKSYFGNRIDRLNGFVSELKDNGITVARMIANASKFSMQRYNGEKSSWEDCIYFDPIERKYSITGDVTISGVITALDLATSGKTTINGDNITTGTLNASLVKILGTTDFYWDKDNICLVHPTDENKRIYIGKYDGRNYGIGITTDNGSTWSTAIDFDGVHVQHQTEYSGVTVDNNSLSFTATSAGLAYAKTCVCRVIAYTGSTKVLPVIGSVTGVPDGMSYSIGEAVDNAYPIMLTVVSGALLGGTEESASGEITVNVTSPVTMALAINWCKVNTGADGEDGAPGRDGQDGAPGQNGTSGFNQATIVLYKRASSTPAVLSSSHLYTFASGILSGDLEGWSRSIPAGEEPCYTTSAVAVSQSATVNVPFDAWSGVVMLAQNGTNGQDGTPGQDGSDGYNTATVYLYKRAEETPAAPTADTLYTFSTGGLTGQLSGWTQAIPTTNGNPCWVITTQAIAHTSTVTLPASVWPTAAKLVEDGEAGAKTYFQSDAPTDAKAQDLWIDSDDDNKIYRYNGTVWESVQDLNIPNIVSQLVAQTTTLNVLSGSIEGKVSETYVTNQVDELIKTIDSTVKQSAEALTATFQTTAQDAAGNVDAKYSTLIRASGDGVEIGKSNSRFRTLLTNDRLSFLQGTGSSAKEVAYISNEKLYITDAQVTNDLALGASGGNAFIWKKTTKGLSLRYVSAT